MAGWTPCYPAVPVDLPDSLPIPLQDRHTLLNIARSARVNSTFCDNAIPRKVPTCFAATRSEGAAAGQQHPGESATSKASSDPTRIHSNPPSASPSSTSQNPPTPSSHPPNTADSQALVSNGLWDEARSQLLDEAPQLINAFEKDLLRLQGWESQMPTYGRNEPDLLLLVKQRFAALESSRLGFEVGGKRVDIREQFARTVHAVISVKDSITTVVSSEPHAALAWAGVLVLLNPITAAITQDEDALQGLEFLSDLLIRYRMTELTHSKNYIYTLLRSI